jgi:2-polyprenyl-6-methoxyphenol hydroxylase-like FAD-dependent oxidoreductase
LLIFVLILVVADVPDPDKPETWVFQIMPSWTGPYDAEQTDEQRIAMLKETALTMAEPFKSAYLWIPEGTPMPQSNMMHWVTIPWDNRKGTVTLTGDAAHAMPPRKIYSS